MATIPLAPLLITQSNKSFNMDFFIVLCLPRQVRTSTGATHHDFQLSPSASCNPLSSSSPVTSFSVFLFSFYLSFFPL